jgi:hypothetical protein
MGATTPNMLGFSGTGILRFSDISDIANFSNELVFGNNILPLKAIVAFAFILLSFFLG